MREERELREQQNVIQVDIGGHPPFHWLKTIISDWHFLAVFRVLNFRGHFEALNDVVLGIAWVRRVRRLIQVDIG